MKTQYNANIEDKEIFDGITAELSRKIPEWYGEDFSIANEIPAVILFTNSFILRYRLSAPGKRDKFILVKIRRHPKMTKLLQAVSATDLHRNIPGEYAALQCIYKIFNNNAYSVGAIRPLVYLERWFALVTEEVQSNTLRQLLMNRSLLFGRSKELAELLEAAKKTGRWLSILHKNFSKFDDQINVILDHSEQADINNYAIRIEAASSGQIRSGKITALFAKSIETSYNDGEPKVIAKIHGDFTCDNILYSRDRKIYIVDIKGKYAPVFYDLGLILIHPESFRLQIASLGTLFRKRTLQLYRKAILDGYFEKIPDEYGRLNLYCAICLLDKWVMYEEIIAKHRGYKRFLSSLFAVVLRIYFYRCIQRYLSAHSPADI